MKFLIALIALVSLNAFAQEKVLLDCTTPGDALDAVKLVQKDDSSIIRISGMDESVQEYTIRSNLRNIAKGEADTLVGTSENSEEFGGAVTNAVLIRVLPGQKSAFLASNGAVFNLNCFK